MSVEALATAAADHAHGFLLFFASEDVLSPEAFTVAAETVNPDDIKISFEVPIPADYNPEVIQSTSDYAQGAGAIARDAQNDLPITTGKALLIRTMIEKRIAEGLIDQGALDAFDTSVRESLRLQREVAVAGADLQRTLLNSIKGGLTAEEKALNKLEVEKFEALLDNNNRAVVAMNTARDIALTSQSA